MKDPNISDLRKEKNVKKLRSLRECGIYFLCNRSKIVYVGQSTNLYARINSHKDKTFNSVYIIECSKNELDELEKKYIKMFKPIYNDTHNKVGHRISFWEKNGISPPASFKKQLES